MPINGCLSKRARQGRYSGTAGVLANGSGVQGVQASVSADKKSSEISFGKNLVIAVQITHYHNRKATKSVFKIDNASDGTFKDANGQDIQWRLGRMAKENMTPNKLTSPDNLNCFYFVVNNNGFLLFSPDPSLIFGISSEDLNKIDPIPGAATNASLNLPLDTINNVNYYRSLSFDKFNITMRTGSERNPMFFPVALHNSEAIYNEVILHCDTPTWFEKIFWDDFR